jgi:fibronectin type 3 domain-containing protein
VGAGITISTANVTGTAFAVSGLPTLPFTLTAGQSQQFGVTFSPVSGSPGAVAGSVSFTTGINTLAQTFSGTGARNVLLTWGASTTSGVTYNVYRCSGTCASYPTGFSQIATGINVLTYTDADSALTLGQTYVYAVTAVNAGGESTPAISNGASFNF